MSNVQGPAAGGGTPSDTVVTETSHGQASTAGVASAYSRGDHTHGSPTDPVPAHVAAADPHTVYQKESEKDAVSGYAGLDASSNVNTGEVATASIEDNAVTNAKLADMPEHTVKVRQTFDGDPIDLVMGPGTVLVRSPFGGSIAAGQIKTAHIEDDAVDSTKLQNFPANSILARVSSTAGDPSHLLIPVDTVLGRQSTGDIITAQVVTNQILDNAVTYPKMQNVSAASKLLGRGSAAGAGDPEEITLGTNLSMSGTTLNAAAGGGGGPFTAFTQDLGAARRSGTFDVTGLSGLTAGNPVEVMQTLAAIASKGNAVDEPEMDTILVTAEALDATSFRARWFSADKSVVVGTYAFAWR